MIPSHMAGDAALVRATDRVADTLVSLSHGTGRAMSRAASKDAAGGYAGVRHKIDLVRPVESA